MTKYKTIKDSLFESLNLFIRGEIENEQDFVEDYLKYGFDDDIGDLLMLYFSEEEEDRLLKRMNGFIKLKYNILNEKIHIKYERIKENIKFLPYPDSLCNLIKERLKLETKIRNVKIDSLKTYFQTQIYDINEIIANIRMEFINHCEGNTSVSVHDGIAAFMIFNRNIAHNISSHSSMHDDYVKSHSAEILLDKYMLELDGVYGLPTIKLAKDGTILIGVISSDDLRKDLLSLLLVKEKINLSVSLECQSIYDEAFIIEKIYQLFNSSDSEITHRDIYVFIHTMMNKYKEFDLVEVSSVRQKLNTFMKEANKNKKEDGCYYDFLYLLYHLKVRGYILNAKNFSLSMGSYFNDKAGLSSRNISKYFSEKDAWEFVDEKYSNRVIKICGL